MKIDIPKFLADAPSRLGRKLSADQVTNLRSLLESISADPRWTVVRQCAYFLATVAWETGWTFYPIGERRASKSRQPELWRLQERYWPSGFFGRGLVQITWLRNYLKLSKRLAGTEIVDTSEPGLVGVLKIEADSFVKHPDLVLHPPIAYEIATVGMIEGLFTGKKLADYIPDGKPPDYFGARRIINGRDRASEIAAVANSFELLLRASATP